MGERRRKAEGGRRRDAAYKRYRAPSQDGAALFDPNWEKLPALLECNRREVGKLRYDFDGCSLAELRNAARGDLIPDDAEKPLVLSGHQPELFHPGVWIKNFALGRLAQRVQGVGANLVIDSDLCRAPSIKVPTGAADSPRVEVIPFDAAQAPLPFEERGVVDTKLLGSFPTRVSAALEGRIEEPLIHELWPLVLEAVERTGNLGLAIAEGRHRIESQWGNHTREVPMSRVCDSRPFRVFAWRLLSQLDRFHAAYNQALAEYRQDHRLRTPAQPLPDLHAHNGWLEAPFWVWTAERPVRRPLFARRESNRLLLSDQQGNTWTLDAGSPVDSLEELRREHGVKVRSRALITTLYSRLLLADLFLHGIGGAKYDQVTDRIAELFFGFRPPPHATLTATLRLPIGHEPVDPEAARRIAAELRAMEFHPERLLGSVPGAQEAIAEKRRWIETEKTPTQAAERHRAIVGANAAMRPMVVPLRQALLAKQEKLSQQLRAAAVLESREYAYCLFPGEWLRARLLGLTE